jgi:uncharacterized protein YjiS (DUF1127 family)
MNTSTAPTALTAPTDTFARIADYAVAKARAFDAWLATRRRVAQDLDALAAMSDRELHDIGLSRGSTDVNASAAGRATHSLSPAIRLRADLLRDRRPLGDLGPDESAEFVKRVADDVEPAAVQLRHHVGLRHHLTTAALSFATTSGGMPAGPTRPF